MGCENLIKFFFQMTTTIKLYHWETTTFSRHRATDDLHGNLLGLIDEFIEVYIGRYKRPKFGGSFDIEIPELNDTSADILLKEYIKFLKIELPKYLSSSDTDLLNIRDDMLSNLNKTIYLFTLN